MANSVEIKLDDLTEEILERIFKVWVEVAGCKPRRDSLSTMLEDIEKAKAGDALAKFKLDSGYRFGSKIGDSKLGIRIFSDKADIRFNDNVHNSIRLEKLGDEMRAEFAKRLKEALTAHGVECAEE